MEETGALLDYRLNYFMDIIGYAVTQNYSKTQGNFKCLEILNTLKIFREEAKKVGSMSLSLDDDNLEKK